MNMAFFATMPALRCALAILAAVAALAAATPGHAAGTATDWVRTEAADVRLVAAVAGTGDRETVPLGLEFRLSEGWKVYWRSAGDAGYPPQVDWAGSSNLAGTEMRFPVPHRFSAFGLEQIGYTDHVVYPIAARLGEPGAPLSLRAAVNALVCSEICIPLDASLALDLPASAPKPTPYTQLLDRWSARVPSDLPGLGLDIVAARAEGDPANPTLVLTLVSDDPLTAPDVFLEGPAGVSFGKPEVAFGPDRRTAVLRVPAGVTRSTPLSGASLTLTVADGDRFAERTIAVDAASGAPAAAGAATWLAMLGAAVLGGLILNLMPCVLPVLSLKLLSAVGYGGAARGAIRRGFLASAAGIMASFLLLAGGAVALKSAGIAIGWGIQFQQPLFLAAMATLVVLFAANLWGLFEVALPRAVADLGARLPSDAPAPAGDAAAGKAPAHTSLVGHFLTGAFATLLATPCSAPFLGTAIGFALARGSAEIVAVFAAMGLGLALPYLAVAAVPDLARALPRPGRWMTVMKRVLSVALAATAAWLLTVLAAQTGSGPALAVAAVFATLVVALMLLRHRGLALPLGALAAAAALAVAGIADRPAPGPSRTAGTDGVESVAWQPFDRGAIDRLVADGRVVLVDVTADWCLTCKVNKAAVLNRGPVAERLGADDVLAMRADWTNPNPAIAEYLASFGRYGIPFNAVYGPAAPHGIALPELLTEAEVLAAFGQAGAGATTARVD